MQDILLAGVVCAAYVGYKVYIAQATQAPGEVKQRSVSLLVGLDWRRELDLIETALRRRDTTVHLDLLYDRLQLSLADGTRCGVHVRHGLRRFLSRRIVIVWHLTDHRDLRKVLVSLLLQLTPTVTANRQLDWIREWRDVLGPLSVNKVVY